MSPVTSVVSAWMVVCAMGCGSSEPTPDEPTTDSELTTDTAEDPSTDVPDDVALANVTAVEVNGESLAVTIESSDTGCEQYANWWEVISLDGALLYRRILAHSHVDEQPFTRSGGLVNLADQEVIVRAHMHPGGYGGRAMKGTAAGGFALHEVEAGFAAEFATALPQPDG